MVALAAFAAGLAGTVLGTAANSACLFLARAASMGAYTALYIYTPEAYPTRVRSLGLGVNSAIARVGALVSPALAVGAVRAGHASAAEAALAAACAVAAIAVFLLKVETGGVQLPDSTESVGAVKSPATERLARVSAVAAAPLARVSLALHTGHGSGRRGGSGRRASADLGSLGERGSAPGVDGSTASEPLPGGWARGGTRSALE